MIQRDPCGSGLFPLKDEEDSSGAPPLKKACIEQSSGVAVPTMR